METFDQSSSTNTYLRHRGFQSGNNDNYNEIKEDNNNEINEDNDNNSKNTEINKDNDNNSKNTEINKDNDNNSNNNNGERDIGPTLPSRYGDFITSLHNLRRTNQNSE